MLLSSTTGGGPVLLAAGLAPWRRSDSRWAPGSSPCSRPVRPDPEAAIRTGLPALVDHKLDGVRVQVHRDGDNVRVFTRSLDDITGRLPGVVRRSSAAAARLVLDGEVLALRADGRPETFQVIASRSASETDAAVRRRTARCGRFSSTCCTSTAADLLDAR